MNNTSNIKLFWSSIKYTPNIQIFHRIRLKLKRGILVQLARLYPQISQPKITNQYDLSENLPAAVIPSPARGTKTQTSTYIFDFLNVKREYSLPIPWHDAPLNVGTRLWKLNLHYFDHTHNLSDEDFSALVSDWIAQNRPYGNGYWLDSWNSYAISIRLVAWMGEYQNRYMRLNEVFLKNWQNSIREQLLFLQQNLELDIGGNHIIKNIRALYWSSKFFKGSTGEEALVKANLLLTRELNSQFLEDGFHFELSPAYHCQVFTDLLDCWRLLPSGELKNNLGQKLSKMAQIVVDLTHTDGFISLFNDGGLDMAISPKLALEAFNTITGQCPKPHIYSAYPNAGYFAFRDSNFYLVYDAGRVGPDGLPAHAHGDVFSFELSVSNQRIFVDKGVYEYNSGPTRSLSRSTLSHNTLNLDKQDQAQFWSAFRVGERPNINNLDYSFDGEKMTVTADHDGYSKLEKQPIHKRKVTAKIGGTILIEDEVIGGTKQIAESRLLLHPDVKIISNEKNRLLLGVDETSVELIYSGIELDVVDCFWWPNFGVEQKTKQLIFNYGVVPNKWQYEIRVLEIE